MPNQGRISKEAERLCLTVLLAVVDQRCDDRMPLLLQGVTATTMVDALHLLAHQFVSAHHPDERPTMREDLYQELAKLE